MAVIPHVFDLIHKGRQLSVFRNHIVDEHKLPAGFQHARRFHHKRLRRRKMMSGDPTDDNLKRVVQKRQFFRIRQYIDAVQNIRSNQMIPGCDKHRLRQIRGRHHAHMGSQRLRDMAPASRDVQRRPVRLRLRPLYDSFQIVASGV